MCQIRYLNTHINILSIAVAHHALDQKLHEQVYRRIVRYEMPVRLHLAGCRGIHPCFQVSFLPVVFEGLVEIRDWQSIIHDFTGIPQRSLKELSEIFELWVFIGFLFFPALNVVAKPNDHCEVRIHQQDCVVSHFLEIQLHWFWLDLAFFIHCFSAVLEES